MKALKIGTKINLACLLTILMIFAASQALADTLNLTTLPSTMVTASDGQRYYVGAVGGNLNGGTPANFYCDDIRTTTDIPNSFKVSVATLADLSKTKFGNQADALMKYEQVGWLMYEMQINPTSVAAIQFAMWSVFTPSAPTYADSAYWLDASTKINPADYDFSKMRIYTPSGTKNQEFVGGSVGAAVTPEPAEWVLLILGLGLIAWSLNRNRNRKAYVHVAG